MEGKKISFGFMKSKKVVDIKPVTIVEEEKREYIECVEEKSIKVVGGEVITKNEPLVIPLKPNTLITAERLKEIAEKVESAVEEVEIKKEPEIKEEAPVNETLEQMAIRELMQEAKKEVKVEDMSLAIPAPAKPVIDGEKESTLDDYESVPVQHFGLAMLRGMGWTPNKDAPKYKQPELRPKGLGLGAEKVTKRKQKEASKDGKVEEELAIVKNSFVKITAGKYSGYYGKVLSLDEDNGRVMVDITVKKETVSLSEFMMQAVTKTEYDKESKVINQDTYNQYKNKEKSSQKSEEISSSSRKNTDHHTRDRNTDRHRSERDERSNGSRDKSRHRRTSSSSEERIKKKDKRRDNSSDSLSSRSDDDKRRRKHKSKSSKRYSSSEPETRRKSPSGKKDIDKKRKGKKKKRDRDRSPHYRKHKK